MQHCLILDIGKTNKKAFIFDEDYRIVHEVSTRIPETVDEDGFPCEDAALLQAWIESVVEELLNDPRFHVKAINCTAYGATFVHLDASLQVVAPIYNYLKPHDSQWLHQALERHGTAEQISLETASPLLGNLNSGLQLLYLKTKRPRLYQDIKYSVHLPQWVAFLANKWPKKGHLVTEMTSLGCHTLLWDFRKGNYHEWVKREGLNEKFPAIQNQAANCGLHDSSASLIPYLKAIAAPFVLLSTGTWCISLNPFNTEPLSLDELNRDCLCYLSYENRPVKAARYFGGHEHEQLVQQLSTTFSIAPELFLDWMINQPPALERYREEMTQIVSRQVASLRLAIGNSPVQQLLVDGGFSRNSIFLSLLAAALPELQVYAAEVPQATASGAAMAIHALWNRQAHSNTVALRRIRASR